MSYTTKKGTQLPLINLKGKQYMQVAHRLVWLTEEVSHYTVATNFLKLDKDESVVNAIVSIFDETGKLVKSASATKREDSKGFADHAEKAETGAIGRALAMLGFGTQFAIADMEENDRLADSPVTLPTVQSKTALNETQTKPTSSNKFPSFRKTTTPTAQVTTPGDDI